MPRPGFVLEVDRSTPPTLFWHGEGFSLERLPVGSRVLYAPEPTEALRDPDSAIRHALLHPLGDSQPLPSLLRQFGNAQLLKLRREQAVIPRRNHQRRQKEDRPVILSPIAEPHR